MDVFHQLGAPELAEHLAGAKSQAPLAVPVDFKGADATLMYRLSLAPELRQQGLNLMQQAVEKQLRTPLTQNRGLGGFVEVWREYAEAPNDGFDA